MENESKDQSNDHLTGKQRSYLRRMAHDFQPVVRIGQQGDTESVRNALDEALEAHELVKVRFLEAKEDRRRISSAMAENLDAQVVDVTGNVALLYRSHADPERRQYTLP